MKRRKLVVAVAAANAAVLMTGTAFAVWTATATTATQSVPTDVITAPVAATATAASTTSMTIAVTTKPSTGPTPTSYQVDRTAPTTASPACNITVLTNGLGNCTDSGPLTPGTPYTYSVKSKIGTNWVSATTLTGVTGTTTSADTTAPTVSLTFPASPGPTTYKASQWTDASSCTAAPFTVSGGGFCGTAADATSVSTVKISIKRASDNTYWNGAAFSGTSETFTLTTLGTGTTSRQWVYSFALPADGTYTVHLQAADTLGNAQTGTTYAATSTFTMDQTAPSVSITSPAASATVSGTTAITSTVSDATSGVASVQYQRKLGAGSFVNVGTAVTSSPFSGSWVTQGLVNGSYTLQAIATDKAGNTTTSGPIAVTLTNLLVTPAGVNGTGTAGRLDAADKWTLSFPNANIPKLNTFCGSWTVSGTQTSVTDAVVTFTDGGAGNDSLTSVTSAACGTVNAGTLDLGSISYLDATGSGTLVFTGSTIAWTTSSKVVTITLGSLQAGGAGAGTVASTTLSYTPSVNLQDSTLNAFDYAQSPSTAAKQF
jgi:hypothetical protein